MYLNLFRGIDSVKSEFEIDDAELAGATILLAHYDIDGYEGDAFVLFERDGKLYEVNGSHCSCYGLEGQWQPEETSVEEIRFRMEKGYVFAGFKPELRAVLDSLETYKR